MQKYFTKSNLGTAIGVVVCGYLLVTLVGVVKRNHDLQVQVSGLNGQIKQLQDQQTELNYQISYFGTDAFKEKEARAKLGLASPGESLVILPKDKPTTEDQTSQTARAHPKSHIAQWFSFFFGT